MIQQLSEQLVSMGQVLLALDTGVGLLVAVGFSMSASHLFSLLANRLTPRQILHHMVKTYVQSAQRFRIRTSDR